MNEWDVYGYPTDSAGWTNLTTPDTKNSYVVGCSASGSRIFYASKQASPSTTAWGAFNLFAVEGSIITTLFEANLSGIIPSGMGVGGATDKVGGDGVDVSVDGTVVFSAGAKATNPAVAWPERVVYMTPRGGRTGTLTQITTGVGGSAAYLPRISDNGNWVTVTSPTVYGEITDFGVKCRPPFTQADHSVVTSNIFHIWRYNVANRGSGDEYDQGWITADTYFTDTVDPGFVNHYGDGLVTDTGQTVVFSALSDMGTSGDNTDDLYQIGFAMFASDGTWKQGRLTRINNADFTGGFCGGPGRVIIHQTGDWLPEIVFLTNVKGFDGRSPDDLDGSSTVFDPSNQRNTTRNCWGIGSNPPGDGGIDYSKDDLRLVYLDSPNGDFIFRDIVVFEGTTDVKRIGNLEWSKDGREIVFTAKLQDKQVIVRAGDGKTVAYPPGGSFPDKWAVYRIVLGNDSENSKVQCAVTVNHIMPKNDEDFKNDDKDGGPDYITAFIAR